MSKKKIDSENKEIKKDKTALKRKLKYGSLSVVLSAIIIAVVIVANVFISALAAKFPSLSVDTSIQSYYELDSQSLEYLKTLDDYSIELVFIGAEIDLKKDQYYSIITKIAEVYAQNAKDIKVSYVDLDLTPGYAVNYDDFEFTNGDVIVKCEDRYRILTSADFLVTNEDSENSSNDESNQSEPVYRLNAEYAFTTSIMVVTASDEPKATFITGHGEPEIEQLKTMLENNGFETKKQNILEELDYESNILIIAAPTKDYSEDDLRKLDDFLDNNGEQGRSILYIADYSQPRLPNLEEFLKDWGIIVGEGIVYESDDSKAYGNMPQVNELVFVDEQALQSALAEVTAFGYYGRPTLVSEDDLGNYMESSVQLEHSMTSKIGSINAQGEFVKKEDQDPFNFVAMTVTSRGKTSSELVASHSNVMYVNSLGFFQGKYFERDYSANPDVTMNTINSMLGREDKILLPTKSLSAASLGITYNQIHTIGAITTVVVPVLLLAVCLFVYIRRRFL